MNEYDNQKKIMFNIALAKQIGLNEAIILNQIKYWCNINQNNHTNFKEGYYWTFNTYENWSKQFPFWSISTIKRTIFNLEKNKLIITANYNKKKYDRTKWYRVNEQEVNNVLKSANSAADIVFQSPIVQNEQKVECIMNKTIPYNNKYDNRIKTSTMEQETEEIPKYIKDFILTYMNDLYFQKTKKKHPAISHQQYDRVAKTLYNFSNEFLLDYDDLIELAIQFFSGNIETDYNINHFATEGILEFRYYEVFK